MKVIDVVPHVRDRSTVMGLLYSTAVPYRDAAARPFKPGSGYQFTVADVVELAGAKRTDLAELILEGTEDESLLYGIAQERVPVAVLKAVCRNGVTPADLLVFLACDSRSGVSGAAMSAIARRMRCRRRGVESLVETLKSLLHCPGEEVAGLLEPVMRSWISTAADFAVQCVLARPELLDDSAWDVLSEKGSWQWAVSRSSTPCLTQLVRYPTMSDADLETIYSKARFRTPRGIAAVALMARRHPGSDEWFDMLTQPNCGPLLVKHPELAALLSDEQVRTLFYDQGSPMQVLLDSGRVSDADVEALANNWLAGQGTEYLPVGLLRHPATPREALIKSKLMAFPKSVAMAEMAQNPALAPDMQMSLADDAGTRKALATNAKLTPEAAAKLIELCMGETVHGQQVGYISWRSQDVLLGVLANAAVPDEVRLSVSSEAIMGLRQPSDKLVSGVVAYLDDQLSYGIDEWKTFLSLVGEWSGTVGDLVRAVRTL